MAQRIFEMAAGGLASALGFALLLYLLLWPSIDQRYSYFTQTRDLTWLPAFLAFAAALAAIAVGALLHGIPSLTRADPRARVAFSWASRSLLWLSTMGLIALVYLSGFSIGLLFIPSAFLALIASILALIPGPARNEITR
jgi:hypothetical protein